MTLFLKINLIYSLCVSFLVRLSYFFFFSRLLCFCTPYFSYLFFFPYLLCFSTILFFYICFHFFCAFFPYISLTFLLFHYSFSSLTLNKNIRFLFEKMNVIFDCHMLFLLLFFNVIFFFFSFLFISIISNLKILLYV